MLAGRGTGRADAPRGLRPLPLGPQLPRRPPQRRATPREQEELRVSLSCFRRWDAGEDPEQLLIPENQCSTPWGDRDHGQCDKCAGRGTARYRCLSCLADGTDDSCPACAGRVEFDDVCPACEGSGEISRTTRRGVSAFPTEAGLYRYLGERDVDLDDNTRLLELEGQLSGDRDLDADSGAILVIPTKILGLRRIDEARLGTG